MQTIRKKHLYKLTVAAMCMALGLVLPFLTGQFPEIGNMLLPMHLPIFLCGILCGAFYGAVVGAATPLLRSLLFTRPMFYPTALSMSFELAAYGALVGLFVWLFKKKTPLTLYAALISAMLGGRVVWAISRIFMLALDDIPFSFQVFLTEGFVTAALGIAIQLVLIPAIVVAVDPTYRRKTQPAVAKITTGNAVETAFAVIDRARATSARVSVAIEGRAAAGKTTLAAALAERLCATVVHTDEYLLPFDQRSDARMAEIGGHFDYERFKNEVLLPWQRGENIVYRAFDCKSGEISSGERLADCDVLIVEGAYSRHPALDFSYTLTVFCDIDTKTQYTRITERNSERTEMFFSTWIPKEEDYFEKTELLKSVDFHVFLEG